MNNLAQAKIKPRYNNNRQNIVQTIQRPEKKIAPTYIIMRQEITLFTIILRIWWFFISILPVAAIIMFTYTLWIIKDQITNIANSLETSS
jgi:hypothetical protein